MAKKFPLTNDVRGVDEKPSEHEFSPYFVLSRKQWAQLRADTPLTLTESELEQLRGINEPVSMTEVTEVYLPLSRLLNLHVTAARELHMARSAFLSRREQPVPFIIGLAGSVAVGKSTTGRILQALLSRWPHHPRVALVPTDGFLRPNSELAARGIMDRKGFPESYDIKRLLAFLGDIKSGREVVQAPVYSHFAYDIIADQRILVERPDILILEGLNVLQPAKLPRDGQAIPFVSDFFDFSIYLHAPEEIIERWYVERFLRLRETAFRDPASYFHRYSKLDDQEAIATAKVIWRNINLRNLKENILPTRQRADLILHKGEDHAVEQVAIRKI